VTTAVDQIESKFKGAAKQFEPSENILWIFQFRKSHMALLSSKI
jgi:hypothetical protein